VSELTRRASVDGAARTLLGVRLLVATDGLPWIVGLCVLSVIGLILIVVAPWRGVRREPPLDDEVEARLLLGEDPDDIDRDLAANAERQRMQEADGAQDET